VAVAQEEIIRVVVIPVEVTPAEVIQVGAIPVEATPAAVDVPLEAQAGGTPRLTKSSNN
jgi:hypothetical protein